MAGGAVIGSLRAVLGIDTAQFEDGLKQAQKSLKAVAGQMQTIGDGLTSIGSKLSLAITAPFVALGTLSAKAATESAQALAQVEAAQKSMGNASGIATAQLQAQAGALQDISTFDDDDILKSVTANLLTFGNVAGTVFTRAQAVVVDLSARLGQDLQSSTIQVGKALNDPIKGITALQRVGVAFSADQKKQIEGFVKSGDAAKAQAVILKELESEFGGAAKAMRDATPGAALAESWRNFTEAVGGVINQVIPPVLDALKGLLDAFTNLSPGMQGVIVAAAAIAAALGPVLVVVGTLISTIGGAVAGFGALAGAGGIAGLIAATGPLLPILAGLALALAAVGVAGGLWLANSIKQQVQNQQIVATMGGAKTSVDAYAGAIAEEAVAHGKAAAEAKKHTNELRALAAMEVSLAGIKADAAKQEADEAAAKLANFKRSSDALKISGVGGQAADFIGGTVLGGQADTAQAKAVATRKAADAAAASLASLDKQRANPPKARKLSLDGDGDGAAAKAKHGRSVQEIADELALEAAKARGDTAEAQRLENQVDLQKRIRQYEDAGLAPAAARQAAEGAIATLKAAQAVATAKAVAETERDVQLEAARTAGALDQVRVLEQQKDLESRIAAYEAEKVPRAEAVARAKADQLTQTAAQNAADLQAIGAAQDQVALQVAQIDGNVRQEELLQHQQDLRERITFYQQHGLNLEHATTEALKDQLKVDEARAAARQQAIADLEREEEIRLAQARGDTSGADRLQRQQDIEDEAKRRAQTKGTSVDAERQGATDYIDALGAAKITGSIKSTVHDGIRAALNGDLGSFVESFWKEHLASALSKAFDSLIDNLAGLIGQLGKGAGSGSSGGDIFGSIFKIFTGGLGGSSGGGPLSAGAGNGLSFSDLGFATGGSFKVGGPSGIDRNLVQFRASRGEVVDITKPGQTRKGGAGDVSVAFAPTYNVQGSGPEIDALRRQMASDQASFAGRVTAAVQSAIQGRQLKLGAVTG